jgi:hypothetical protein
VTYGNGRVAKGESVGLRYSESIGWTTYLDSTSRGFYSMTRPGTTLELLGNGVISLALS